MNPLERDFIVKIRHGVHGRIATKLALIAAAHEVKIHIVDENGRIDCSSVLDVLSQAYTFGTRIRIRAEGSGTGPALAAVEKLLSGDDEQ